LQNGVSKTLKPCRPSRNSPAQSTLDREVCVFSCKCRASFLLARKTVEVLYKCEPAFRKSSRQLKRCRSLLHIEESVAVVSPGMASAHFSCELPCFLAWAKYWEVKSSGRQTIVAPFFAAEETKESACARFSSLSLCICIWISPIFTLPSCIFPLHSTLSLQRYNYNSPARMHLMGGATATNVSGMNKQKVLATMQMLRTDESLGGAILVALGTLCPSFILPLLPYLYYSAACLPHGLYCLQAASNRHHSQHVPCHPGSGLPVACAGPGCS